MVASRTVSLLLGGKGLMLLPRHPYLPGAPPTPHWARGSVKGRKKEGPVPTRNGVRFLPDSRPLPSSHQGEGGEVREGRFARETKAFVCFWELSHESLQVSVGPWGPEWRELGWSLPSDWPVPAHEIL